MRGEIDINTLATHALPLEQIQLAFDLMHDGDSIRTIIDMWA